MVNQHLIIEVYTDGACSGNPGPGGWGVMMRCGRHVHEMSGGEAMTTNNRMELMAAIQALESIQQGNIPPDLQHAETSIKLYTDSTYVRDGITQWVKRWKQNGWKTAQKTPVKNVDLWQRLDDISHQHTIEWCWIKGHSGHPENERADMLARTAIIQQYMHGQLASN